MALTNRRDWIHKPKEALIDSPTRRRPGWRNRNESEPAKIPVTATARSMQI